MELKKYKIKEICLLNRCSIKSSDQDMCISYLDTSSITNGTIDTLQDFNLSDAPSRAQRMVKHNTIVYSTVRPNLRHFGIIKQPQPNMIVSTGFTTLDIKDASAFSADYIYYLLTQQSVIDYLQIVAQNNVSAYPSLNPSDIGNLTFAIPCIGKQKRIAKLLSDIDRKIELNRAINRNLPTLGRSSRAVKARRAA